MTDRQAKKTWMKKIVRCKQCGGRFLGSYRFNYSKPQVHATPQVVYSGLVVMCWCPGGDI